MKKTYAIENLDCANCGAKIEAKLNAHPAVHAATVTFATMRLTLEAEDPDALLPELEALARTVEDQVSFLPEHRGKQEAHAHCGCGHDHDHDHEHGHEHSHEHEHGHSHGGEGNELPALLLGAGLFLAGLFCGFMGWGLAAKAVHIAAYLVLGLPILKTAAKGLLRGKMLDENFLMSIATLGAFCIDEFPEAVGVMLFYRVGEYFEHRAVERSRSQIMDAIDLRPETVNLLHEGHTETVAAEKVRIGQTILVRVGDRIPLDGEILSGESRLDTAPITGESVPVGVKPGDRVLSGCVNLSGQLELRVEKPLEESMVSRILRSVESAAASKPKIDRFITRFARVYTPVVVALAAAVAIIPSVITGDWGYWVYTALSFLVMSCPCALVLSVPLAFFSGIGVGSRQGILFKGGASMEALAQVKAAAMDKTGTLTKGSFEVRQVIGGEAVLAVCAACEENSTHPIAKSILAYAKEQGISYEKAENVEELAGHGIRATVGGREILCGNEKLLKRFGVENTLTLAPGSTWVLCAAEGKLLGAIRIADELKPDAAGAVKRLGELGLHTAMLTGDNASSAEAIAKEAAIGSVYASLLPDEKLTALQKLRQTHGAVLFVGDGINDAPVLSGADVGAAMGSGADAALEAADIVFMTSEMESVPRAVEIARRTKAVAWQNVIFALAVKALVMVLGLMGHASMWLAVFADSGVAMLCVLNSVRMLYTKKQAG